MLYQNLSNKWARRQARITTTCSTLANANLFAKRAWLVAPWYKHHIYAPGFYTGYGVKTIPGVREAIEQRQFDQVAGQIEIAAQVLTNLTVRLDELVER